MGTVYVFACTVCLIVPFIQVYTRGITDANYIQPFFAFMLVIANGIHCLRIPYVLIILAVGHYKETQTNYIITAMLNIVVSVVLVIKYGLIGVTIGTFISMFYQTVWMACYVSDNIIKSSKRNFVKLFFVDVLIFLLVFIIVLRILQVSERHTL